MLISLHFPHIPTNFLTGRFGLMSYPETQTVSWLLHSDLRSVRKGCFDCVVLKIKQKYKPDIFIVPVSAPFVPHDNRKSFIESKFYNQDKHIFTPVLLCPVLGHRGDTGQYAGPSQGHTHTYSRAAIQPMKPVFFNGGSLRARKKNLIFTVVVSNTSDKSFKHISMIPSLAVFSDFWVTHDPSKIFCLSFISPAVWLFSLLNCADRTDGESNVLVSCWSLGGVALKEDIWTSGALSKLCPPACADELLLRDELMELRVRQSVEAISTFSWTRENAAKDCMALLKV